MIGLANTLFSDWQALVVLALVVGAVAYLVLRGRGKKNKACGSSQCDCVKKK